MSLVLDVSERCWPLREPFAIARGISTAQQTINVIVRDGDGIEGRGEACGIPYEDETVATMRAQLAAVADRVGGGLSRAALQELLPAGGARFALDSALWDHEAKRSGMPVWRTAGLPEPGPIVTAYTIGIRDEAGYRQAAEQRAAYPLLKVKVNAEAPLAAIRAVRRGAPGARLIVDPNQSWTVDQLRALAPSLADLGVVLLEQPIPVGAEVGLDGYRCPVPLCADELVGTADQIGRAVGWFDAVNIKLDKTGGLTGALRLAEAADAAGLGIMVGCMAGSSLCMAPAFLLAQRCDFTDLDGPLLQATDWPGGLVYEDGRISPAPAGFWGDRQSALQS